MFFRFLCFKLKLLTKMTCDRCIVIMSSVGKICLMGSDQLINRSGDKIDVRHNKSLRKNKKNLNNKTPVRGNSIEKINFILAQKWIDYFERDHFWLLEPLVTRKFQSKLMLIIDLVQRLRKKTKIFQLFKTYEDWNFILIIF